MPNTDKNRPLRVFLCHASNDKPTVRELHRRLRAVGFEPWFDEESLLPGQDWRAEISKAVRATDVVIVCLSSNSINKEGYVQKEIKVALDVADEKPDGTIFLIPLRLEECQVPERLSRWQWVNHFDATGYLRLVQSLSTRAEGLGLQKKVPIVNNFEVDGMKFVLVPAGKFSMGSKKGNLLARENEMPRHSVEIPYDYWLSCYPVTNARFAKFIKETAHEFVLEKNLREKDAHPVANVSWQDAMAYCNWLNALTGIDIQTALARVANTWLEYVLRLPTEAEWEKAARGTQGNEWPWGNQFHSHSCNSREGDEGHTTRVGVYSPEGDSPYGGVDLAGNIWEWCHSVYRPYPYRMDDGRESEAGYEARVLRGGSWRDVQNCARCAFRYNDHPALRYADFGFRVVIAPSLS